MEMLADVQAFVRDANRATSLDELGTLLDGATTGMGFRYFALGHHVNVVSGDLVQLGNYPQDWMDRVLSRGYISVDPALVACQYAVIGFLWSEIPKLITLTPQQKTILEECSASGFGEGFTVPIHLPGEYAASCTFVMKRGVDVVRAATPAAHYIGCFAFEAARRLSREGGGRRKVSENQNVRALSPRQLDCIVLAARGKSDTDAGTLLGISNQTVHQHIETAKRRYGVATRTQLIVRVLFDSQLTFRDVLSG